MNRLHYSTPGLAFNFVHQQPSHRPHLLTRAFTDSFSFLACIVPGCLFVEQLCIPHLEWCYDGEFLLKMFAQPLFYAEIHFVFNPLVGVSHALGLLCSRARKFTTRLQRKSTFVRSLLNLCEALAQHHLLN